MMMVKDSQLLYANGRLHNSVYFAVFALEAYIKIILIKNGKKHRKEGGHISDNYIRYTTRMLQDIPDIFDDSLFFNMINKYNINCRYKIEEWIDPIKCKNIQNELKIVNNKLNDFRINGL